MLCTSYQVVSTGMDDSLQTGKLSQYNQHQGQLSLPSLWGYK